MHFITMEDTMHCITTEDKYLLHFIWIKPCVLTCTEKIGCYSSVFHGLLSREGLVFLTLLEMENDCGIFSYAL